MFLITFFFILRQIASHILIVVYITIGKSTFMTALAHRELPIPEHFDIFHLTNEIEASDKTALECVMEVQNEKLRLEKEADELAHRTEDEMAHER